MKNKVLKVLQFLILFAILYSTQSNATSLNLSTNSNEVKANEDVIFKINTDKDIEATTFFLKYDSTKLKFEECTTPKIIAKDYPEEGILRVIYIDTALEGTSEICLNFKARENVNDTTQISITNLTLQFLNDSTVYTEKNLEQSTFENTINIKSIPKFSKGIKIAVLVIVVLVVLLILVTIESKKSKKKNSNK